MRIAYGTEMKTAFVTISFMTIGLYLQAQNMPKDTLYLLVDRSNPKVSLDYDSTVNNAYLVRKYEILVLLTSVLGQSVDAKPWTFRFLHNSQPNPGGLDSSFFDHVEITKDTSFLSDKKVLTYDTLKTWGAPKTFSVLMGWWPKIEKGKPRPVVFIVDKADIKDGRILLLEVLFETGQE